MSWPSTYDAAIDRRRGPIPRAWVKALMRGESNFDPAATDPRSSARGLLGVVRAVLKHYNETHARGFTAADLFKPDVNIAVALWLLRRIVQGWGKQHPATLAPDWRATSDYPAILVHGYNAGYSERGGVGLVASYLERHGLPVTLANIERHARAAGAARFVGEPARVRYARKVAGWYRSALGADGPPVVAARRRRRRTPTGALAAALAVGLVALAAAA